MRKPSKPVESYTEKQAIATLMRLAKRWPKSLWLYAASGTTCIMRCKEDGSVAFTGSGGVDPAYEVCTVKIPSDGGDW